MISWPSVYGLLAFLGPVKLKCRQSSRVKFSPPVFSPVWCWKRLAARQLSALSQATVFIVLPVTSIQC